EAGPVPGGGCGLDDLPQALVERGVDVGPPSEVERGDEHDEAGPQLEELVEEGLVVAGQLVDGASGTEVVRADVQQDDVGLVGLEPAGDVDVDAGVAPGHVAVGSAAAGTALEAPPAVALVGQAGQVLALAPV